MPIRFGKRQQGPWRLWLTQPQLVDCGVDDAKTAKLAKQFPQRLQQAVEPERLLPVAGLRGPHHLHRDLGQDARDDAIPGVSAGQQRLCRAPVAAIADREAAGRAGSQGSEFARHGHGAWQGHLDGRDIGNLGKAAEKRGAEGEMRRARIVVDAERQAGRAGNRDIVPERLFLGQRRIGDGRKKQRVRAFGLGIVNKMLEPWAGAVLAKVFVLVAIMLFIQRRPRGLFAQKGRAAEA